VVTFSQRGCQINGIGVVIMIAGRWRAFARWGALEGEIVGIDGRVAVWRMIENDAMLKQSTRARVRRALLSAQPRKRIDLASWGNYHKEETNLLERGSRDYMWLSVCSAGGDLKAPDSRWNNLD
jgi:hypothetical protein